MIGNVADDAFQISPTVVVVVAGAGLVAVLARARHSNRSAPLIACALIVSAAAGAVRHAAALRYVPAHHVANFVRGDPVIVTVDGRVGTAPRIVELPPDRPRPYPMPPKTRFVLHADAIAGTDGPISASGMLDVTVKEPMPLLAAGDAVRITGRLYAPHPPSNPGAFDWARYLRRQGIFAALSTDHAAAVVTLARNTPVTHPLSALRTRARRFLLDGTGAEDDPAAGVISAMVLGQRGEVDATINEAFVRTGTAHFLAASGMHVGWLALMAWWVTRLFGLHYRRCAVLVALVILAYMVLAEPRPAILRAGVLGILACGSIHTRGKINVINWLSASALVILLISPAALFRPGFQFSFVAILAIVFLTPRISAAMSRHVPIFRELDQRNLVRDAAVPLPFEPAVPSRKRIVTDVVLQAIRLALAVSLAAWIGNIPLACFHFNQFSPFGAIFTMLLWGPAFLVTATGFVKLALGFLLPSSAAMLGPVLHAANGLFVSAVRLCAAVPMAIVPGNTPSLFWVAAVYGALAAFAIRPALLSGRRWGLVFVLLAVWWILPARWVQRDRGTLNVWILAVGDGTGTVIELPDGRVMLFDFGTRSPFDPARVAEDFFACRGIRSIESAFVTHANYDHYGAIETIVRNTPIARVEISDQFEPFVREKDGAWFFLKALREAGAEIRTLHGPGRWTDPSGVQFELLGPPKRAERPAPSANDSSLALRLTYQGASVLLTGDQAEWGLGGLIASGNVGADVLALPHHGGVVHNTAAFLAAVDPTVAVRSIGQARNLTTNGIEGLVGEERAYYSTADDGCVRVRVADGIVKVTTMIARE